MNMAHSLVLPSFLFLFTFSNTLLAQDTQWTTPPPAGNNQDFTANPIYAVNSVVQLAWVTTSSSYSIWLWQQTGEGIRAATAGSPIYTKADGQTEAGGTLWQVTTENFLLSDSNVFFLALGSYADLIGATTSHYFNITNSNSPSSTSSSSSASAIAPSSFSSMTSIAPSSSITTAPSTTANPPATSSASASSSANQGNGSSNVTGIGLGVGLGVGIPIILILAALLFLKIRKPRGANKATNELPSYREERSESFKPMVYDK